MALKDTLTPGCSVFFFSPFIMRELSKRNNFKGPSGLQKDGVATGISSWQETFVSSRAVHSFCCDLF